MNRQLVIYLSIALSTVGAILFATSQAGFFSPNTQKAIQQTQQHPTILYSITDLGTLGDNESFGTGINDLGQVVGNSSTSNGELHAFLWDKTNGMQQLYPDSSFQVNAMKIDNSGRVVCMRWKKQNPDRIEGMVWDSNNHTSIEYGKVLRFNDINDAGQVVGQLHYLSQNRALLWNSPDDIEYLGTPGKNGIPGKNAASEANRINNASQVVGVISSCQKWPCGSHAFLWDRENGMIDLGTFGSRYSNAYGINDREQVVGVSSIRGGYDGQLRAFLWDKTRGLQNLGTFDDKKSYARDINNAGQVVGYVGEDPVYRVAFIWDKTRGLQDLNQLIDPKTGWRPIRGEDINENGWIVGTGWFNGKRRALLLTPVLGIESSVMTKIKIATTADVSADKILKTSANGQSVLVAKVGDRYCSVANKCPHLGLPLAKGKFENGVITCPFHGSKFEVCTGKNVEWVDSFVGIPLPGAAKKIMAMGKAPTDVASFMVTKEGEDLFIDA